MLLKERTTERETRRKEFTVRIIDSKNVEHVFWIDDERVARNKYEAAKRFGGKNRSGCLEQHGEFLRCFTCGEEPGEWEEEISPREFQYD